MAATTEGAARPIPGLELRLERGAAFVALPELPLAPGVDLVGLEMEVPGTQRPFDVSVGPAQFRHHLCELDRLEIALRPEGVAALAGRLELAGSGIASLELALRSGFVEGAGALEGGARFTVKLAVLPAGDQGLELAIYEPRLYAPAPLPAAVLPARLAAAAAAVLRAEGTTLRAEPLPALLRRVLPPRGWKVPRAADARLALLEVTPARLRAAWRRGGAAAAAPPDPDLLAALEGARAFADAERHLAAGELAAARDAYRAQGPAAAAHPFAAARLLSLLVADPASHGEALAMADALLARRKGSPAALLARALVLAARGDAAGAAAPLAEHAAAALRRGEEGSALAAAEACVALGPGADPAALGRAVEIALSLRRDHLPALRALRDLGERGDREALLRACRRLAAYAPGADEKADAHARLGRILAESDPAAARLHLDHALRLAPADRGALAALARACEAAGDHVRAVRALDRARELAAAAGDAAGASAAALEVAALWERAGQLENALLRCREACALAPSAEAEARAASLAEALGQQDEAARHHARLLELLPAGDPAASPRLAAARAALARWAEAAGDLAAAAAHAEAAAELAPGDADALRRLDRLQAALGRADARRATLDRLAAAGVDPAERRAALVEAARLSAGAPDEARRRWEALRAEAAGASEERDALAGLAGAAAAQGDAAAERDALERLAALAPDSPDAAARADVLDRLAGARERTGDLAGALEAAAAARAAAPAPGRLEAELRLARAAGDAPRLAALLAELVEAAPGQAASALLERSAILAEAGQEEAALAAAREAARLEPERAEAHERVAALAAGRDPALEAEALLIRAELARRAGEPDAAARLAVAGQAALAAGRAEGEAALRDALGLGLHRDDARAAWAALQARAAERGDPAGEREALAALAPLLPTGQRPAAYLRLSGLALAAGDAAAARDAAERARTLAPRDPAAAEACRAAAEAQGDAGALPELLAGLAALAPDRAGPLLLERARRLRDLGRAEEADAAMGDALARLAPDAALTAEHARLRQEGPPVLRALPWFEPLETFGGRVADPADAARAFHAAAVLALSQGLTGAALRCARAAAARAGEDLGLAGPLLATLLHRLGSSSEALALHRRLLEAGLPGADPRGGAELCRDLADLAEHAGDVPLALAALDRLLALQPHDVDAALRRFGLDPDRARAVTALAAAAQATRRVRARAEALSVAAEEARRGLADPALADALFARARLAAGDHPRVLARVEARRVAAIRPDHDPAAAQPPAELIDALRDLASALDAAGDRDGATACLEEATALAARHGLAADPGDLARLEARARDAGDLARAARHAREAGLRLVERDPAQAEAALRRALAHAPGDLRAWQGLEAAARARGAEGEEALLEALLARAARDPADAAAAAEAAPLLLARGRAAEAVPFLWAAVRARPDDAGRAAELEAALGDRPADRAELAELRARSSDGAARAALLRDAARWRAAAGDDAGARAARRAAYEADPAQDAAFDEALREAAADVDRTDAVLAARAAAVPAEAAARHRARAEALAAAGRLPEAAEAWAACAAAAPDDPEALALAAGALAAAGRAREAEELDRRLTALADRGAAVAPAREADARWRLGAAAAARGELEAVRHLARALQLAPADPRAAQGLELLARADAATPAEAEAALPAASRLADSAADDGARLRALEAGARLAARCGDRGADAAGLLERLAAAVLARGGGPEADALAERALDALLRAGENARASALVARAARTTAGPRRAAWLARLAASAAARGDLAAARAAREEALLAEPGDAALREAHLADLEASGDAAALVRALDAALAAPGADVAAISLRRARALAELGDVAEAERAFAGGVALGPGAPGWDEAARALRAALEAREDVAGLARLELACADVRELPRVRAAGLVAAAQLFARSGDLEAARRAAGRACEVEPDGPAAWRALARIARTTGDRLASAQALLGVAIRSEGADAAAAALEAAELLDVAGRTEEATRALQAAIAAVPGSPEARRALADRARAAGDRAGAARHLAAIDADALPPDERAPHERALALALQEAGDPGAEAAWGAAFRRDPTDPEAFQRAASLALGRGDSDRWLGLAAEHEGALAAAGDTARRRDLRCERAALLTDLGRLDAAEGAWQAALQLDPGHRRALRGLRALLERRGDHGGAAAVLDREARAATDPVEAAELFLDEARLRRDQLRDREGGAAALAAAAERLAPLTDPRARALAEEVDRMRAVGRVPGPPVPLPRPDDTAAAPEAGAPPAPPSVPLPGPPQAPGGEPAPAPGPAPGRTTLSFELELEGDPPAAPPRGAPLAPPPPPDDDLSPEADDRVRALADAAQGAEKARLLDLLATRLARQGDASGAAEAALAALGVEPTSADRFRRALALAGGDRARATAAHRLRARAATTPQTRAEALRGLGELLAQTPDGLPEAAAVLERACGLAPASGAAAAALARALVRLGHPDRALAALAPFEGGAPDLPAQELARLVAECADAAGVEGAGAGRQPQRERARAAQRKAELAVAGVRAAPFDRAALSELADAAGVADGAVPGEARRHAVLARTAADLDAFAAELSGAGEPVPVARLTLEDRQRAAHPLTQGPLPRLLALLAPWLEGLFPADLARRGVTGRHRLSPQRAPEIFDLLEELQAKLGSRPVAAFLADAGGCAISFENTQPPSLVLGAALAGPLPDAERRFLLARALALVDHGWALLGKFAPRDVVILCEVACRFAGAALPSRLLPDERARPFLAALERAVPAGPRQRAADLAAEAGAALGALAPADLARAVRHTAGRVALLHVGSPGAALRALVRSDPRLTGAAHPARLAHPDVVDLAAFAVSDAYLDIRAEAEERG